MIAPVASPHDTSAQPTRPVYRDIDCGRCGHQSRHVVGRETAAVYCLGCGGECRRPNNPAHMPTKAGML